MERTNSVETESHHEDEEEEESNVIDDEDDDDDDDDDIPGITCYVLTSLWFRTKGVKLVSQIFHCILLQYYFSFDSTYYLKMFQT